MTSAVAIGNTEELEDDKDSGFHDEIELKPDLVKDVLAQKITQAIVIKGMKKSTPNFKKSNGVRMVSFVIGDHTMEFKRNDNSKNKLSENIIVNIIAQINHFLAWLQLKEYSEWLNYFNDLIVTCDRVLKTDIVDAWCQDVIANNPRENLYYRNVELDYFRKFLNDYIIHDQELLKMISEYVYDITVYNFDPSTIGEKLEKPDMHIIYIISFYMKLIHILYFPIGGNGNFGDLIKNEIITLSNHANVYTGVNVFTHDYDYLSTSFLDRMYTFVSFSVRGEFKKHAKNINKFGVLGISEQYLIDAVTIEILTSLYRVKLNNLKASASEDKFLIYNDINQHKDYGYVTKMSTSYIQEVKKKAIQNKVGVYNPPYILREYSNETGSDDTSDTSRIQIYLEKKDKEWYKEFENIKNSIMEDIRNSIAIPELIDSLMNGTNFKKTPLNETLVHIFLEKEYKCDVSEILNRLEFITVCVLIHERINKYPKMRNAMLGSSLKVINIVDIKPEDLSGYLLVNNTGRVLKTLQEICKIEYVCVINSDNEIKISPSYNVKDEILKFFKNGCSFE